jgi:predicted  nucleic acid-binding Zn-ribbon protein
LSVQRGSAKKRAGDDWVTPEDLDRERLQEENQTLAAENLKIQQAIDAQQETLNGLTSDVAQKKTTVTSLRTKKSALEAKLRTLSAA